MKERNVPLFIPLLIAAAAVWIFCARTKGAQSIPTLDPNFRPVITRLGGSLSAVAVQADGKVVLAGATLLTLAWVGVLIWAAGKLLDELVG